MYSKDFARHHQYSAQGFNRCYSPQGQGLPLRASNLGTRPTKSQGFRLHADVPIPEHCDLSVASRAARQIVSPQCVRPSAHPLAKLPETLYTVYSYADNVNNMGIWNSRISLDMENMRSQALIRSIYSSKGSASNDLGQALTEAGDRNTEKILTQMRTD